MKKILRNSIILAIIIMAFLGINFISNAATINSTDVTLYAMSSLYDEFLTIPDNLPQEFQIQVSGASNVTYKVISGDITVTDEGVIKPKIITFYYAGDYYTTNPDYSIDDSKSYTKPQFGDSVVRVTADGQTFDINVHVLDYLEVHAEEVMDNFIKENITSSMTDMEKADAIVSYVTKTYDYRVDSSSAVTLIAKGGGDCWANSDLVIQLGLKAGLNVWERNANRDTGAGSGHVNVMFEDNGKYYILEAGTTGTAPRAGFIMPKSSLFSYEVIDDKAYIYQYDGKSSDKLIEVPSQIDEYTVVGLENGAFDYKDAEEIILPSTITSIGASAFSDCDNLKKINIPEGVTTIENMTFYKCTSLEEIVFPDSLEKIGDSVFRGCTNLKSITIPENVTSIGTSVFAECPSLSSVNCDSNNSSYTSVDGVLYNKNKTELLFVPNNINSLDIADTVEVIATEACRDNPNLKEIVIPESVKQIGDTAFYNCSAVESITFEGNNLERLERGAFWNCNSVSENIVLPESLQYIGEYAFCQIYDITEIVVPASVTEIGEMAFFNCKSLERIIFYKDMPKTEENTFFGMKSDSIIYYRKGTNGFSESNTEYSANFEKASYSLTSNNTQELNIEFLCKQVEDYVSNITYTSSNTNVAYFEDENKNIITAKNNGTTQVTATITYKDGTTEEVTTTIDVSNLKKGDVNKDGKVALYDAFRILRYVILGGNELTPEQKYIMDYNDDGKVALYDAFRFLRQVILS